MIMVYEKDRKLSIKEMEELNIDKSTICKCRNQGVFVILPKDRITKGKRHMQCRLCGMMIEIKNEGKE